MGEARGQQLLEQARWHAAWDRPGLVAFLGRPRNLWAISSYLIGLPTVVMEVDDDPVGKVLGRTYGRAGVLTPARFGAWCLPLPATMSQYLAGSSRKTLRKSVNRARREGITTRRLVPEEIRATFEHVCRRRGWRHETVLETIASFGVPMEDLVGVVAIDADGSIEALELVLVSGSSALASWSMSVAGGLSRWAVWATTVEVCLALGVATVTVTGDHYFARRIGFERANLRVVRRRHGSPNHS